MQFYRWQGYRCAYERQGEGTDAPALLLIHPVGVGLSSRFWLPFAEQWQTVTSPNPLFMPDLLGCGASVKPRTAYRPKDWAAQLKHFIETVVQQPVILVVQGALLPVGLRLAEMTPEVKGLILSGPPNWSLMTEPTPAWRQRVNWNLFNSLLGWGFYQYARRRQFLRSFSRRQLFEKPADVTDSWLSMLEQGAEEAASRHAVFSFLAGFWRQDYTATIAATQQPTLVIIGQEASSISRSAQPETAKQRLQSYLDHFPHAEGKIITGRNVMPYESPAAFVDAITPFIEQLNTGSFYSSSEPSTPSSNSQSNGSQLDGESNGQPNNLPDNSQNEQLDDESPDDESNNEQTVDTTS